ncbi:MAG: CcmD family protein [Desulfovibrionaceae bacterium]
MNVETTLFAVNLAVWLGLGGYVAFLAVRARRLDTRLTQLERMHDQD